MAPTASLSAHQLAQVRQLCHDAFDGEFSDDDWAHLIGGHHAVLLEGDTVISHAAVVARHLTADTTAWCAGYVEAVATAPARHGEGFGTTVLRALQRHITQHYDLGALSTGEQGFYARLGWESWQGPTYVRTTNGLRRTIDEDDGVMVLRFGPSTGVDLSQRLICDERTGDNW